MTEANKSGKSALTTKKKRKIAATWMKEGTLDRWRHHRMLSPIKPFISGDKTWLTVGDVRYGTDAHFIISEGGIAHASDISDRLLKIGSDAGFIGSFSAENAERLSFADNSFDRTELAQELDAKLIGNRMLFGVNLLRQPAFVQLRKDRQNAMRVLGETKGADELMLSSLFLGTFPGLTGDMVEYVIRVVQNFIAAKSTPQVGSSVK